MDTWHDMGHMSNLSKLDKGVKKKEKKNHFLGEEGPDFGLVMRVREGEKRQKKKKKKPKLLSSIHEVPSFEIHRAKSESSSTR